MARRNNSLSDENITASDDELTLLTIKAKQDFAYSINHTVDLHDPDSVKDAINHYFDGCIQSHTRPGNLGLYRALGMDARDIHDAINRKNKSRVSPECIDLIQKARHILSEYREQLGSQGKINPVTLIFWEKNYDGLTDQTRIEVSHENMLTAGLSPEQIARRIEKDIPIDALEGEYKEIETDKDV